MSILASCSFFYKTDVPKDLEECFERLNIVLPQEVIEDIKNMKENEETVLHHLDIGMWIRNHWGLWKGNTALHKMFIDRKIYHPDEMSGLILRFYYEYLNGNNENWKKWMETSYQKNNSEN